MGATFDALQGLAPPAWVRVLLITAVLGMATGDALVGRRSHGRLLIALRTSPDAEVMRARFLYRWAWAGWITATIAVVAVWALPGVNPVDLGLQLPDLRGKGVELGLGFFIGGILAVLIALTLGVLLRRAAGKRDAAPTGPRMRKVVPILPTGRRDRRAWVVLSVTAGVIEEVTYRGLALLAVAVAVPVNAAGAVAIVAVLFGAAHAYQGLSGVLVTGVLGVAFAGLYLGTGSLLPGMVLHALLDLNALQAAPRPTTDTAPVSPEPATLTEAAAYPAPQRHTLRPAAPPSVAE